MSCSIGQNREKTDRGIISRGYDCESHHATGSADRIRSRNPTTPTTEPLRLTTGCEIFLEAFVSGRSDCNKWCSDRSARAHPPRASRAKPPQNAVDRLSVVDTRHVARLVGQQRLNDGHSASVSSKRRRVIKAPASSEALNHSFACSELTFMSFGPNQTGS
jgi:hypothetical protein